MNTIIVNYPEFVYSIECYTNTHLIKPVSLKNEYVHLSAKTLKPIQCSRKELHIHKEEETFCSIIELAAIDILFALPIIEAKRTILIETLKEWLPSCVLFSIKSIAIGTKVYSDLHPQILHTLDSKSVNIPIEYVYNSKNSTRWLVEKVDEKLNVLLVL